MKESDILNGLFLSLGRAPYSAKELVSLAAPFSITEGSVRTWLSRQLKTGFLEKNKEGAQTRYGLSDKGKRISSNVSLSFSSPDWSDWDGRFWGFVFSVPEGKRQQRHRLKTKLSSYRFASWYGGFWIRPASPDEGITDAFTNEGNGNLITFLPEKKFTKEDAQRLWDIGTLNGLYIEATGMLRRETERLSAYSPAEAHVKRIETGNVIVPLLFKDPLLPNEYLPEKWAGEQVRALFGDWDRLVRTHAKPFWEHIFNNGGGKNEP